MWQVFMFNTSDSTQSNTTIPQIPGFVQSVAVLQPADSTQLCQLLVGGNTGADYTSSPIIKRVWLDFDF